MINSSFIAALIGIGLDALTAAGTAAQVGALLNSAYSDAVQQFLEALSAAGLPFHGIVPTDQVPQTGFPQLAFGYPTRNPDAISDDWGFEVHSKYYWNEKVTTFLNYTWFNNPAGIAGDLNFPQNKSRAGVAYAPQAGFNGRLAFQWDQAYNSTNATFPGRIKARSLLDLSLGYTFDTGLSLEASATNLFNNEFRSLPGFPKIGRLVTGRVLYDF